MIFSLGKGKRKEEADRPLEEETIERWREISERSRKKSGSGGKEARYADFTLSEEQIELDLEAREEAIKEKRSSLMSKISAVTASPSDVSKTPQWPEEVEEMEVFDVKANEPEQLEPIRVSETRAAPPKQPAPVEKKPPSLNLEKRFGSNIKSALGPGTVVEGKFQFDSPVRIDGSLSGDVDSNSALIVGEQATVTGNISVGSLIILGQVSGEVVATELVEVGPCGRLEADIRTDKIVINEGGIFRGGCNLD